MNTDITKSYDSNYTNTFIIWIIALCSLKFFTFLTPSSVAKASVILGVIIILVFLIMHIVYGQRPTGKKKFFPEVIMIFAALLLSTFAADFFHDQSLSSTLLAQFPFYFFLFYFLIHRLRPDPEKILPMIIWLAYIYTIIYFLQYLAFPKQIVSSKMFVDRGTVRIFMPGPDFMFLSWFILLSRYFLTKKIINLIGLIPFVIIFILLGTRQVLASVLILTLLNILLSQSIKSKFLIIVLIALMLIPFYFLFQGVFDQLFEVSHQKQSGIQDNIRLLTAHYFLFDFNHNPVWILTGNGMPGYHSSYGIFLVNISDRLGYFQGDVGLIGDFSKFGFFYVLAILLLLFKLTFRNYPEKFAFVRYNALGMILTLFTGAGFLASSIFIICTTFYIADLET